MRHAAHFSRTRESWSRGDLGGGGGGGGTWVLPGGQEKRKWERQKVRGSVLFFFIFGGGCYGRCVCVRGGGGCASYLDTRSGKREKCFYLDMFS